MAISTSSKPVSGSFLWTYPKSPVQIHVDLEVIERLRIEILHSRENLEVWGLLIGATPAEPGVVKVVDFASGPEDSSEARFQLASGFHDEVAGRCLPGRKVVGYFRVRIGDSIQLDEDDLKLIPLRFKGPSAIFLSIARCSRQPVAGFFSWWRGAVTENLTLAFPLSARDLLTAGWPVRIESDIGLQLKRWIPWIPDPGDRTILRKLRGSVLLLAVALAVMSAMLARFKNSTSSLDPPPPPTSSVSHQQKDFTETANRPSRGQPALSAGGSIFSQDLAQLPVRQAVRRPFIPPPTKSEWSTFPSDSVPQPPILEAAVQPLQETVLAAARNVVTLAPRPPEARRSPESPTTPMPLPATPGLLTITSEPSGAAVEINHIFAGSTPLSVQLSPIGLGFTVTINKDHFLQWSVQSVAMDKASVLHAHLTPQ